MGATRIIYFFNISQITNYIYILYNLKLTLIYNHLYIILKESLLHLHT